MALGAQVHLLSRQTSVKEKRLALSESVVPSLSEVVVAAGGG